ncbi:TM0106 family RecB-like putative nuclease [Herbaspirillum chlorophenolicum]|uniref:TM0106 family RecB-like putative nuclease n=1 Tax=Herbaspirillum chlorophenolicum TaxID=211589 RepID=A0ABW8F580_9BURK
MKLISGSMLYDAVHCPHRVSMDVFEDPGLRDDPSPFLEMLWEQGWNHEFEVIDRLGDGVLNLFSLEAAEKEVRTLEAIKNKVPLIYAGRIRHDDLVGEPDLLFLRGDAYIAGDIKSGSGFDGDESSGKLKRHYAVQVAHYTNILELLNFSDGRKSAVILDGGHNEVPYLLADPQGVRNKTTWWTLYLETLQYIRQLLDRSETSKAALSAQCGHCHWRRRCEDVLREVDDLTLIAELGRAKRDLMFASFPNVASLATSDPADYIKGSKTSFPGIGPDTLQKFQARAILLKLPDAKPYFREPVELPSSEVEVFFDIEDDPMRGMCYLHGFVERRGGVNATERYIACVALEPTPAEEERAFRDAWTYLMGLGGEARVYYYSKYERTAWKKLAERYPGVCSVGEVEALFSEEWMVDLLYGVVSKTEWPTNNRSIKTLAKYLGFRWRDSNPSGAASIEWYNQWVETGSAEVRQRILDYNEDDCRATRVLLDGLRTIAKN